MWCLQRVPCRLQDSVTHHFTVQHALQLPGTWAMQGATNAPRHESTGILLALIVPLSQL